MNLIRIIDRWAFAWHQSRFFTKSLKVNIFYSLWQIFSFFYASFFGHLHNLLLSGMASQWIRLRSSLKELYAPFMKIFQKDRTSQQLKGIDAHPRKLFRWRSVSLLLPVLWILFWDLQECVVLGLKKFLIRLSLIAKFNSFARNFIMNPWTFHLTFLQINLTLLNNTNLFINYGRCNNVS